MSPFTEKHPRPLQYYMHDEADAFRLELAGSLAGPDVDSVYQAWRTALSILNGRPVIVDITFIDEMDEHGRAMLMLWHRNGARIVASSHKARELANGMAVEPISIAAAKKGWRQRLSALLFGRSAVAATIPAQDKKRVGHRGTGITIT